MVLACLELEKKQTNKYDPEDLSVEHGLSFISVVLGWCVFEFYIHNSYAWRAVET